MYLIPVQFESHEDIATFLFVLISTVQQADKKSVHKNTGIMMGFMHGNVFNFIDLSSQPPERVFFN